MDFLDKILGRAIVESAEAILKRQTAAGEAFARRLGPEALNKTLTPILGFKAFDEIMGGHSTFTFHTTPAFSQEHLEKLGLIEHTNGIGDYIREELPTGGLSFTVKARRFEEALGLAKGAGRTRAT